MASIFQQQISSQASVNKSQSTSRYKSNASKLSETSKSSIMIQKVRFELQGYEDIKESEFVVLPVEPAVLGDQKECSFLTSYMNDYTTVVPIGDKYQAIIPSIMSSSKYLKNCQHKMRSIEMRKIHDVVSSVAFYEKYKDFIEDKFGSEKLYDDVNDIRVGFESKSMSQNFEEYLQPEEVMEYWEEYFINKEKLTSKVNKKRKKKVK